MKRVIQQDGTGCGIACIAMLAGIDYKSVKKLGLELFDIKSGDELYTTATDLRKLGQKFNLDVGGRRRKFKTFNSLPDLAILAINYRESNDTWHWVVFCRTASEEFVLDPKKAIKSEQRSDFGRMELKTKWFIEVKKT